MSKSVASGRWSVVSARGRLQTLATDHWPLATGIAVAYAVAYAINRLPPLYTAAAVAGSVVAFLLLRKPVLGAYALVLSVPVQKAVSYDAGPIEITVTQVLFVIVLAIWWAWLSVRQDRRLAFTSIGAALLLFFVATLPSLLVTTSMPQSLAELSRWLVTILAY